PPIAPRNKPRRDKPAPFPWPSCSVEQLLQVHTVPMCRAGLLSDFISASRRSGDDGEAIAKVVTVSTFGRNRRCSPAISVSFVCAFREDAFPILFHADDQPAVFCGFVVEFLGKRADFGVGQTLCRSVGIFSLGIVMQHEHAEPWTLACTG